MRAVAKSTFSGVLTIAKGITLLFGNLNFFGRETAPFVRAITKRLLAGFPTGTPPVFTWLKVEDRR